MIPRLQSNIVRNDYYGLIVNAINLFFVFYVWFTSLFFLCFDFIVLIDFVCLS